MGYDKNDKIERYSNSDFETLRSAIKMVIDTRAAATGLGSSDFGLYTPPVSLSTTITAANQSVNTIIPTSPFANGIQVMQDLLKKGYMKPDGTPTQIAAAQRIKALNDINQYSIIPALSDFYIVSNYWNLGNGEASHNGCNGACVGFCTGNCANTTAKGTENNYSSSTGNKTNNHNDCDGECWDVCIAGCQGECGDNDCFGSCISTCGSCCSDSCGGNCEGHCVGNCYTVCYATCGTTCSGQCDGNCKDGCSNTCTGMGQPELAA